MYNNYESYMQSVLGYKTPQNTYREAENYYDTVKLNQDMQEINKLYPEIYGIVYPVVQKVCTRRNLTGIDEKMISQMVEEVYSVIEPGDDIVDTETPLKNGDVRNPRSKETRRPPQRNNRLLRDLIRILILRELFGGGRKPGFGPRISTNWWTWRSDQECQDIGVRPGNMPPIFRPRKPKNILI